ncbi:MAG: hypothetical protein GX654_03835 [Desulfatiglans sp.]|nr:hypothetical protein [Desulfatiglans sp.]
MSCLNRHGGDVCFLRSFGAWVVRVKGFIWIRFAWVIPAISISPCVETRHALSLQVCGDAGLLRLCGAWFVST